MRQIILILAVISFPLMADLTFYDPIKLANRFNEQLHPREDIRNEAYLESVMRAGRNLACGAAVAAYANNGLSKIFHNGIIGGALVKFELLPNLPAHIRHGLFSSEIETVYGAASLTTGRSDKKPNHLKPDVTGLTVGLVINGHWVVLTTTASKGAFADTLEDFSELSSLSARGASILGLLDRDRLRGNFMALLDGEPDHSSRRYPSPEPSIFNLRRLAMSLGGAAGEGIYTLRHPFAGFGTLTPAILSGRRTPFLGYKDIGFGSGHAYLLDEKAALPDRVAFRFGFRLADNLNNDKIREWVPGWGQTLNRAIIQGDSQYLTTEFNEWNSRANIEYEMYIQLEDTESPHRTSIETTSRRWRSDKIPVARLTLLKNQGDPMVNDSLNNLLVRLPFNPGFGLHMPLGNLGYGRAVGPVVGKDFMASGESVGAYWRSAVMRQAIGMTDTGINFEDLDVNLDLLNRLARRSDAP